MKVDLKNRPTEAKKISEIISQKLKEKNQDGVKEGVSLEKLAKDLAKRKVAQDNEE